MRVLICNDDGIDAPGLRILAEAARTLTPEVWIVAPERKWTAASHQLSFDKTLTLTRRAEREYACSGAPADCVVAAMTILFTLESRPDLVLAGLNDKVNFAEDLAYSGTMAIAREATFWHIPAISASRDRRGDDIASDVSAIGSVLRVLWEERPQWSEEGAWLSINLPARLPAPLVQARVGRDKIGGACETLEVTPDRTSFRLVRGRPSTHREGDERAVVLSGCIALVRHRWFATAPIASSIVDAWNRALT